MKIPTTIIPQQGHEVPMDQPKAAWHLYSRFTRNLTLVDDTDLRDYWDAEVQRALQPEEAVQGADKVALLNTTGSSVSLASVNASNVGSVLTLSQLSNAGRRLQLHRG